MLTPAKLMNRYPCRQLAALLVLGALLLAPFSSFSLELSKAEADDTSVCQMLPDDRTADERGEQSNHSPCENSDDSCDNEEPSSGSFDSLLFCSWKGIFAERHLFHPHTNGYTPKVFLAIFVPPEI